MKKLIAFLLTAAMLLSLAACSPSAEPESTTTGTQASAETTAAPTAEPKYSWAIYWYLCGSDLESGSGFATTDLQEMLDVKLPDDVCVVVETGGSSEWKNSVVDATKLQRYLYDSTGFTLVDEAPSASMGDASTLASFLSYAKTNYPAEKTMVLFWNHGGGSVSGAAFDELYDNDSLQLDELYSAFTSVWAPSETKPPVDIIGFDTCLMATIDVASIFSGIGSYLVASEETEPGNGWYYTGWLGSLAANTSISGEDLGKAICTSYYDGCEAVGTESNVTLSLTDLTKLPALLEAYESFGAEALASVCEDPSFFSQFGRAAVSAENYGGNTKEQGYTNMVDLGDIARRSASILPSAQAVLDALNACVLFRVNGEYRASSTGLSCYYSYNADPDDFNGYASLGTGTAFKYYYQYILTGLLDDGGMSYLDSLDLSGFNGLPDLPTLKDTDWDGLEPVIDENGSAVLTLGEQAADVLDSIGFSLYYFDTDSNLMALLGTDNDIIADWDAGVFKDNFRGVWGALDGNIAYMELYGEGEDYNLYSVPVLLNGEAYNLMVVYDFTAEEWTIQGAKKPISDTGMADKDIRTLVSGDEITLLQYLCTISGDDQPEAYTSATVTYSDETVFSESPLPDGRYLMTFEMSDAQGNTAESGSVVFGCENGELSAYTD